jgi:methylglutaconyl-CoA hydratase
VISPYVIDAIGARHARRLFQTGQVFDAREAERIGLVHRCVTAADLDAAVDAEIERLMAAGPLAVREAKALVQRIAYPDSKHRRAVDEENAELIAALRVSPEGQEGLQSFFERRPARWISKN